MNWTILIKDVIAAIFWVLIRALPFSAVWIGACWTNSDAPWFLSWAIYLFLFVWISYISSMVTNALPALVWRYRSKHEIRLIEIEEHQYRQIRLFGIWFYLIIYNNTGAWHKMKLWRAADEEVLRVHNRSGDENENFIKAMDTFVNAWRHVETHEVLKHQTFEGGRLK